MSATYFAPDFKVRVKGRELAADIAKSVLDLTVVNEPDTLDHFSLTLANPYPKMRWTHTRDADLFLPGSSVRIEMGYVDDVHKLFDGEITSLSPSFPESGTPTLRIEGHTRLHWLQGTPTTRTFQKMTDREIAEQIGRELGKSHRTSLEVAADDTPEKHDYVIQYNQTDLAFLFERAQRLGFELLVDDKKLYFRNVANQKEKVCTFVWGRTTEAPDKNKEIFPLRSFFPTMNTLRQISRVTVRGYDPKSMKEIVGTAGADAAGTKMGGSELGSDASADALGVRKEEIQVTNPIASQAEADQLAKAIYRDRALEFLTGNGATIGLPQLTAGCVIGVEGLGQRFDGKYYITQATHSISSTGYTTSFAVRKNSEG